MVKRLCLARGNPWWESSGGGPPGPPIITTLNYWQQSADQDNLDVGFVAKLTDDSASYMYLYRGGEWIFLGEHAYRTQFQAGTRKVGVKIAALEMWAFSGSYDGWYILTLWDGYTLRLIELPMDPSGEDGSFYPSFRTAQFAITMNENGRIVVAPCYIDWSRTDGPGDINGSPSEVWPCVFSYMISNDWGNSWGAETIIAESISREQGMCIAETSDGSVWFARTDFSPLLNPAWDNEVGTIKYIILSPKPYSWSAAELYVSVDSGAESFVGFYTGAFYQSYFIDYGKTYSFRWHVYPAWADGAGQYDVVQDGIYDIGASPGPVSIVYYIYKWGVLKKTINTILINIYDGPPYYALVNPKQNLANCCIATEGNKIALAYAYDHTLIAKVGSDYWGTPRYFVDTSDDNGATWNGPQEILFSDTLLSASQWRSTLPPVCISNGNLFVYVVGGTYGAIKYYILKSTDDGASWTIAYDVPAVTANYYWDAEIRAAGDHITMCPCGMSMEAGNKLGFAESLDGGTTWHIVSIEPLPTIQILAPA